MMAVINYLFFNWINITEALWITMIKKIRPITRYLSNFTILPILHETNIKITLNLNNM